MILLFSVTLSNPVNNRKSLNHKISHENEKIRLTKYPVGINCRPTKYAQEKTLDSRNTHEKVLGLTKYPTRKILDPRNTHEKKPWTNEKTTRKNLGPTKHPREKILDPQNTLKDKMTQWHKTRKIHDDSRWHVTH